MIVLWLVGWIGLAGQLLFIIISLAAGLYYLAELIEEYSVLAKRVIKYMVGFVLIVYLCLLLDDFSKSVVVVGVLCHLCFASLLSTFPIISLLSPGFIGGTLLFLVAHYLAFQYFTEVYHNFQELISFFFVCLWMVPFSFFISLSANDMTLPTDMGAPQSGVRRKRRSGFLALVDIMSGKLGTITPSKSSKSW